MIAIVTIKLIVLIVMVIVIHSNTNIIVSVRSTDFFSFYPNGGKHTSDWYNHFTSYKRKQLPILRSSEKSEDRILRPRVLFVCRNRDHTLAAFVGAEEDHISCFAQLVRLEHIGHGRSLLNHLEQTWVIRSDMVEVSSSFLKSKKAITCYSPCCKRKKESSGRTPTSPTDT